MELWKIENKRYNTAGYLSPTKASVYTEILERMVAPCSVDISQTCWHYSLPASIVPRGGCSCATCVWELPIQFQSAWADQDRRWGRSPTCSLQRAEYCPLLSAFHPPALRRAADLDHRLGLLSGIKASKKQLNRVKWCLYLSVYKCFCFNFLNFFATVSVVLGFYSAAGIPQESRFCKNCCAAFLWSLLLLTFRGAWHWASGFLILHFLQSLLSSWAAPPSPPDSLLVSKRWAMSCDFWEWMVSHF